jgi:hypothetical protein
MAGKDVDTITQAALEVIGVPASSVVLTALREGSKLFINNNDEEVTQADVLASVATAKTLDEIFGLAGLSNPSDHLEEDLTFTDIVGARNSDFPEADLGIFLIVDAIDKDGEVFSLALGSADAIIKSLRTKELGPEGFPIVVRFSRSLKETKKGFHPINMNLDRDATRRLHGDSSF